MENKLEELRKALESVDLEKIEDPNKKTVNLEFTSIDWSKIFSSNTAASTISTAASPSGYVFSTSGSAGLNVNYPSSTLNFNQPYKKSLSVDGDAEFNGDIKWKGRSLEETMRTIEDRLAILVPDPAKLEHFEALKKAYEHYKTLEALCSLPNKEEK